MTTVMLFSPMNKHLTDIFINPIYIIYYFADGGDFSNNNGKNYIINKYLISLLFIKFIYLSNKMHSY